MNNQSPKDVRIQKFKELTSIKDYYRALGELRFEPAFNYEKKSDKQYSNNDNLKTDNFSNISFANENVIETMQRLDNAAVLIFASAKNPGGGVLNGSIAQEEAISYHTTWYFQAVENPDFYLEKGANALNTDKVAVAEGFMLTDINHNEIDPPKKITFIGCAAPNIKGMRAQGHKIDETLIYHHLDIRIEKILCAAQDYKIDNLILGAFGCGIFGLDPSKVALSFKRNIEKNIFSGNITFSILSLDLLNEFKKIILDLDNPNSNTVKSHNSKNKSHK